MSTLAKKKKPNEEPKVITDPRILQILMQTLSRAQKPTVERVQDRKAEKASTALESAGGRSAERRASGAVEEQRERPPAQQPTHGGEERAQPQRQQAAPARGQNAPKLEFPPPPLAPDPHSIVNVAKELRPHLTHNMEFELYKSFGVHILELYENRDISKEVMIYVPAVCRYYLIALGGGRAGIGYLCTANAVSTSPDGEVITEDEGFYLLNKPLHFSIYFESTEGGITLKCAGLGDECLGEIRSALSSAHEVKEGFVVPKVIIYSSLDGALQSLDVAVEGAGRMLNATIPIRRAGGGQEGQEFPPPPARAVGDRIIKAEGGLYGIRFYTLRRQKNPDDNTLSIIHVDHIGKAAARGQIKVLCKSVIAKGGVGLMCTTNKVSLSREDDAIGRQFPRNFEDPPVYVLNRPVRFSVYYNKQTNEVCAKPEGGCVDRMSGAQPENTSYALYEADFRVIPGLTYYTLDAEDAVVVYIKPNRGAPIAFAVIKDFIEWRRSAEDFEELYRGILRSVEETCGGDGNCVKSGLSAVKRVLEELVGDFFFGESTCSAAKAFERVFGAKLRKELYFC